MSETVLPTLEETLAFVKDRVYRTEVAWKDEGCPDCIKSYYEGQHSEAQRILEFLKTGVPF